MDAMLERAIQTSDRRVQEEIARLRQHLKMYEAECSGLREAGFENAQDLFTSYEGLRIEHSKVPEALRHAAKVVELFDDATWANCYMIDSADCAWILEGLAEYYESTAAPSQETVE